MRKLITTAALVAATVGIGAPAAAQAKSYTIKTNSYQVTRLGPLKTNQGGNQGPTIGDAINAFGQPTSRFQKQGGCIVKWKRLGLRIEFYNFGGDSRGICHSDVGLGQSFTITKAQKARKWRTWKGLRIGMTEQRLWDLHPGRRWVDDHEFYPDSYWLRDHWQPYGPEPSYAPTVYAIVNTNVESGDGKVKQLYGWIGAAGE